MKIPLIPEWRHAWKLLSVQAAGFLVFLGAVQLAAQQFEANSAFAAMTHSTWWLVAKTLIAASIPLLRVIHQPVALVAAEVPSVPASPPPPSDAMKLVFADLIERHFSPKGTTMNANFSKILGAIPGLAIQTELAFKGTPSSGPEKAATVMGIVAAALPAGDSAGLAKAKAVLDMAVDFFNAFHEVFQTPAVKETVADPLAPASAG